MVFAAPRALFTFLTPEVNFAFHKLDALHLMVPAIMACALVVGSTRRPASRIVERDHTEVYNAGLKSKQLLFKRPDSAEGRLFSGCLEDLKKNFWT